MKKNAAILLVLTFMADIGFCHAQNKVWTHTTRPQAQPAPATSPQQYPEERPLDSPKQRRSSTRQDVYGGAIYPDYERPRHLIEMGIRVAPSLNFNTAEGSGEYTNFRDNGAGVRMSIGPTFDYFFFKDRYAFSTGLWYTIIRSGYQIPGTFGKAIFTPGAPAQESVYNLQYLQIPLTAKLYANNIAPAFRLYLQCGGIIDIKLAEKPQDLTRNALYKWAENSGQRRQYGFGDFALLLGAGVQYKLNSVNAVNLGVSYQRGLVNVARANDLTSRSTIVSLDLGFKF